MSDLKLNNRLSWRKRLDMINLIVKKLKPLTNIEIRKSNTNRIQQSESNTVIEIESGGGIPEGYEETDVILCVNGTATNGKILFKLD